MLRVSPRAFRITCALELVLYLGAHFIQRIDNALLEQAGYEPTAPVNFTMSFPLPLMQLVVTWLFAVLLLVGLSGSIWFKPWARGIVAATLALQLVAVVVHGVFIVGPLMSLVGFFTNTLLVWLVTVMYWSPIAEHFGRK